VNVVEGKGVALPFSESTCAPAGRGGQGPGIVPEADALIVPIQQPGSRELREMKGPESHC